MTKWQQRSFRSITVIRAYLDRITGIDRKPAYPASSPRAWPGACLLEGKGGFRVKTGMTEGSNRTSASHPVVAFSDQTGWNDGNRPIADMRQLPASISSGSRS